MNTTALSAPRAGRRRRFHSPQFKAEVVGACRAGVSIAGVALDSGINANLLRRWVHAAEQTPRTSLAEASAIDAIGSTGSVASFVPVSFAPMPMPMPAPMPADIRIELSRNGTTVAVTWPTCAAAECGAWIREVLR